MGIFNVIFIPMCSNPYIDFTIYNFHLYKEIWNFEIFIIFRIFNLVHIFSKLIFFHFLKFSYFDFLKFFIIDFLNNIVFPSNANFYVGFCRVYEAKKP